jgi:hypothetical protein
MIRAYHQISLMNAAGNVWREHAICNHRTSPSAKIGARRSTLPQALTHFKPEVENEAKEHAKLLARLADKITGSPFLPTERLLFPRKWASHSCTSWAIKSTIAFAEAFERAGDFPSKFKVGDADALNP